MKAALATPIAQVPTTHVDVHDVRLHLGHSAHGPNVPMLLITFAHLDASGKPSRAERFSTPYTPDVRALFEKAGPLEGKVMTVLATYLGTNLTVVPTFIPVPAAAAAPKPAP